MHFVEQKYKRYIRKTKWNWKWKIPLTVLEGRTLCFGSYKNQIKSKTVMTWSSWKKKEGIFCTVYFVRRKFFNICVLSQCIVYWIHFQNIYTFTYQKTLLCTPLLLVFKIVESLQCILNNPWKLVAQRHLVNDRWLKVLSSFLHFYTYSRLQIHTYFHFASNLFSWYFYVEVSMTCGSLQVLSNINKMWQLRYFKFVR